tara:strand:+ start:229 stop:372 length:144 start_codon:yes stop_codon:yes gene_type:complete
MKSNETTHREKERERERVRTYNVIKQEENNDSKEIKILTCIQRYQGE